MGVSVRRHVWRLRPVQFKMRVCAVRNAGDSPFQYGTRVTGRGRRVRLLREIYEAGTHDLAYSSGDVILVELAREGTFWLPFGSRWSAWYLKLPLAFDESVEAVPGQLFSMGGSRIRAQTNYWRT
jgi:hypothetical protein